MKRLNQKGFSLPHLLLVLLALGIIGGVGYYVYKANQDINKNLDTTNSSQNEVQKQDEPKEAKEQAKPDSNEGYLVIKEWNLQFKVPSDLTDIKYVINGDALAFYAKPQGANVQYTNDYQKFEDGSARYALGTLYKSNESTKDKIGITVAGKKLGNNYYYTAWAFSSLATGRGCTGLYGDSDTACEIEDKAFQSVNELLNTIELAQ